VEVARLCDSPTTYSVDIRSPALSVFELSALLPFPSLNGDEERNSVKGGDT
jgi:hypothetical protein